MSDLEIGPYVVGEKPNVLQYQFLDSNGVAINLTGYTARFNLTERDGTPTSAVATVTDPVNGKVQYTWTGTELTSPGSYFAQFWAGNGGQRYASLRVAFSVQASVGVAPTI